MAAARMERKIVIATITTRHYDFMAAGESNQKAVGALLAGWQEHCRITGGQPEHVRKDDISLVEIEMGQCLRDGAVILNQT
jgi:hypothetical protein